MCKVDSLGDFSEFCDKSSIGFFSLQLSWDGPCPSFAILLLSYQLGPSSYHWGLLTWQFAFLSRMLSTMTPSLCTAFRTAGHACQALGVILRILCCFCLRLEDNTSLAFLPHGMDYPPSSLQINTLKCQQS